jgi:hypothetical protein
MAISNSERIGKGLDALRDGLQPVCERVWLAEYGENWVEVVNQRDQHAVGVPTPSDLAWLLKGMHNTWNESWKQFLGAAERGYTSELREARNRWAHQDAFNSDDTARVLDTAERLLKAINAAEQVATVTNLRRELQRQVFEEQARSERRKDASKPTEGEPLAGLKSWREIVTPHTDVASGNFEQAEFAADLYQVATNNADEEYQDPVSFFRRTYLTSGLSELLTKAASRLSGSFGDPVIDLQTNFGGGKTHSMIALYHLASGVPSSQLPGVGELLEEKGIELPDSIARAVVSGQWLSPSSPNTKPDGTVTRTVWGEIAWQLAGKAGYELVAEADRDGTNPGTRLIDLFRLAGPSIVLIDEWVAYARQLPSRESDPRLIGGTFDDQFTFAQALTEAAAAVDNVVVLVSIPASDVEVGGDKGKDALARLTLVVRRKSAQWKPADDDESFEIVRRRLFEPMTPEDARVRDGVIKAFIDYYRDKSGDFPSGVSEAEYRRRMELSYPIHPEMFDRLYGDWSTLDRFQRTRGVLRLMATVISVLWERGDSNLLIMPGTLPIDDQRVASELVKYLDDGWDPVIRTDIDGANATPLKIDQANKHLGRYSATRRVARAVFLASAPREENRRGIDIKNITLGVAQPGEASGTFADAMRRLSGEATYVYADGNQYWYSLRANITRLATDRALSNFSDENADDEIRRRLRDIGGHGPFAAVHPFPDGPGDVVDDDDGVHLVILSPQHPHIANQGETAALVMAEQILSQRSAGPRLNRNLLVFCAANEARLTELRAGVCNYLAWKSIADEAAVLEMTEGDKRLTATKLSESNDTVTQRVFETFAHILVPDQQPGTRDIEWHQTKPSGAGSLPERIARKLESEERLITSYGGVRVRMDLDRIPLWTERNDVSVEALWKNYSQLLYLPRLATAAVLNEAISNGVSNLDWKEETFAYAEGYADDKWVGLTTAEIVTPRPGGLVVSSEAASGQMASEPEPAGSGATAGGEPGGTGPAGPAVTGGTGGAAPTGASGAQHPTRYYGKFKLDPVRAIRQMEDILTSIVNQLARADGASTSIVVEINSESTGFDDAVKRTVTENANHLGVQAQEFEE